MRARIALALKTFTVILLLSCAFPSGAAVQSDAADIIKYRQLIMKLLDGHMKAINTIVDGEADYWHQIGDHAVAISAMSRAMLEMFPHWTGPEHGETRALAAIWKNWQGFETAAIRFNHEAVLLVNAVGSIDRRNIAIQASKLDHACTTCHEAYLQGEK